MSGTWATDWATNDVVTAAEFRKSVGCIADTTLGVAAATIDFTGIVATFAHLLLEIEGRGDAAAANIAVLLRLNNDSAGNYDAQESSAVAASVTASESFAATGITIAGRMPANTAPANAAGMISVVIPQYAGTTLQKVLRAIESGKNGTTTGSLVVRTCAGFWRSTAAVNRITLIPGAGNFAAGTRASLYVMGS